MFNFDIQRFDASTVNADDFGTITSAVFESDTGLGTTRVTYNDNSVHEYRAGFMSGQDKRKLEIAFALNSQVDALKTTVGLLKEESEETRDNIDKNTAADDLRDTKIAKLEEAINDIKSLLSDIQDDQKNYIRAASYNQSDTAVVFTDGWNNPVFTIGEAEAATVGE